MVGVEVYNSKPIGGRERGKKSSGIHHSKENTESNHEIVKPPSRKMAHYIWNLYKLAKK